MAKVEEIQFTVDAGIINRLGIELVSKSETAVSELIKNAYDADANIVNVTFYNANKIAGGTLIIDDDGVGMSKSQLINGFMRLATSDKLHNPVSDKYKRPKAGKKGIGRFATQRLGERLVITTQTAAANIAFQLTIDWNRYKADVEITDIKNALQVVPKTKVQGTTLTIESLRDTWSEADIKRVYRYVSELIQPNLLKVSKKSIVQENRTEAFEVVFREDSNKDPIADVQTMMFDRAILTISGYIDKNGYGFCKVDSKKFRLSDTVKISSDSKGNIVKPFQALIGSDVVFKVYYFIGDKAEFYYQNVSKMELKGVIDHLKKNGGVKIYRNGFKVAPYGDKGNDWLEISKKSRIGNGVPFTNNNLIGFVQINDSKKIFFEEIAGREGIIEKDAFKNLQLFVSVAIEAGFKNFVSKFKKSTAYKEANKKSATPVTQQTVQATLSQIQKASETLSADDKSEEQKAKASETINKAVESLTKQTNTVVGELEMLRVLAGVGLTIGEFIHEIKQFTPSFSGYINNLKGKKLGVEVTGILSKMQDVFTSFQSYTAYFDATISQNVLRELHPIDLRDVVDEFTIIAQADLTRRGIDFKTEFKGWDLITQPMHVSEWNTILQNLYSNSKKAILRAGKKGKILIKCHKSEEKLFLSFCDNGDGIEEQYHSRIFDAFYTTSTPVSSEGVSNEVTGSGLGLHILKQMIINRNGKIFIDEPFGVYKTCITIELPLFTEN